MAFHVAPFFGWRQVSYKALLIYKKISELRLVYRTKVKASERLQIKCSKDAFDIFMENWDHDSIEHIEEFKLLLMNRSNSVLGILAVSKGGLSGTVTDVRLIFQGAIKTNASGNLNPSDECVDLISEGYISSDTVNICDDCWDMIEHPQDDMSEMHTDADMGL